MVKSNLSEKISPYISLGEVLLWMAEHPEVLKTEGSGYLWIGGRAVGVVLEMTHKDDTYYVTVYDVCPESEE